eukprot:GILJ01019852.1.p1 GENE.GILJ01019852.1~~GILJ01019852.1.p1  ORF type:complete len:617 (+),score=59.30 GILJ01019852.1:50-1852(+)
MVAAIERVEEDERQGRTNVPLGEDPMLDPPTWDCAKCTTQNTNRHSRCLSCSFPKPEPSMCALCLRDYTRFKICHYTKQNHETWHCNDCQTTNLDTTIQCRRCRNKRTFFCTKCLQEVPAGSNTGVCVKCGFKGLASSLGSLVNRKELESMGLDMAEIMQERETERSGQENRDRLKYRIEQVCLDDVPIGDDGNCLYRALSYQLLRTDIFYACLRWLCVDYINSHRNEFIHFVADGDLDVIAKEMGTDKAWGDELALRASAYALPANLHVITSDSTHWHMKYYTVSKRHLVLCYARPTHFSCATLQALDHAKAQFDVPSLLKALAASDVPEEGEVHPMRGALRLPTEGNFGPKAKELLAMDAKERAAMIRVAKEPSHRVTLADFHRMRLPIIVTVTLGDTSTRLSTSERREIVGRTVNPMHFYLILVDADMVSKNIHNNFDAAKVAVKWQLPFPLFLLQRVDNISYLTPNMLGGVDEIPFGSLQRTEKASSLITNHVTTDYSSALMVAEESSVAGTLFKLRFVNEQLPCRYMVHLDNERVFVSANEAAASLWSLQTPFHSDKQRYCVKCQTYYRLDVPSAEGGCQHRHCLKFIRIYEDDK